jgi:Holliday junction resolvase RusA-like endonuclease
VTTKSGKRYQQRYNSPETTRFYYEVWVKICALNAPEAVKFAQDAKNRLEVYIDLHPPSERPFDADNFCKIVLDSLQHGGLIANDNQISRLVIEKMAKINQGKCVVRIKPYE